MKSIANLASDAKAGKKRKRGDKGKAFLLPSPFSTLTDFDVFQQTMTLARTTRIGPSTARL